MVEIDIKFKLFKTGDAFLWMALGFGLTVAGVFGLLANLVTNSWSHTESWVAFCTFGLMIAYVSSNYFVHLRRDETKSKP